MDDAGRSVLSAEVDRLLDLPGRGGADALGGHLVVRLPLDRLAAGGGGGEVDEGGFVGRAAETLGGGRKVDLQQVPPRRVGRAALALGHGLLIVSK
ncbi:hypothetical protein [Actinacidiphila guanduensis]|uniref:hypothetical protein n=1 Tax=Actinacidiphila guanduensis TaxID=310781 RepID=UPI00115F8D62|nr:hypothetical protein [Actinacidiphila guanduensis]